MSNLRAFTMPKWGIEMTEGTVAEWMAPEGERFTKGQILALIETDKITNEVEAEGDYLLARLVAEVGETYPVGALLAVFSDGEASADEVDRFIASFRAADTSVASATGKKPARPAEPVAASAAPEGLAISPAAFERAQREGIDLSRVAGSGRGGRITLQDVHIAAQPPPPAAPRPPVSIEPTAEALAGAFASPLAKRLAVRHQVDLAGVSGTGPRGRISKQDVLAVVEAQAPEPEAVVAEAAPAPAVVPPAGTEVIRMSPMRKAIARQLSLSKATIPHFYLRMDVRVDGILALRDRARAATGEAPSVNDYLVRAVALALMELPDVNIQVHGDDIHRFASADIAVAVATDKGLITPIVRGAERLSVAAISREVRALAERARAGKLQAHEFQGGSFSISNLGMFGIDQFDAIINPPQGAILAVGAAGRRPIERDHGLAFATQVSLSLSCDHRAIDGAVGARFMAALRTLIETPERLTA